MKEEQKWKKVEKSGKKWKKVEKSGKKWKKNEKKWKIEQQKLLRCSVAVTTKRPSNDLVTAVNGPCSNRALRGETGSC